MWKHESIFRLFQRLSAGIAIGSFPAILDLILLKSILAIFTWRENGRL